MTRFADIEKLRNDVVKSIYGRRLGLDHDDFLVGPVGIRNPIDNLTSGQSTMPSTGTLTLQPHGISLIGTTASSGTSVASTASQQLPAPSPGARKSLFNITTGQLVVSTVTASAFFFSSQSSTMTYLTLTGKGANAELIGLTTALWGCMGVVGTSLTTNATLS
ncbi:MAG TPA: hypothetical protein ENI05_06185 [Porticoccus sp.]|nr:hypothetical protein [Porticoccus sp.]